MSESSQPTPNAGNPLQTPTQDTHSVAATEPALAAGEATALPEPDMFLTSNRDYFFWIYSLLLVAVLAGFIWSDRPTDSVNDQSRWNTVWSLIENGTYVINPDDQFKTIDMVVLNVDGNTPETFSSKPPLLPTVIAGYVWVLKQAVREPFVQKTGKMDERIGGSNYIYTRATLYLFQLLPFWIFLLLYKQFLDYYARTDFAWYYGMLAAGLGTYLTGYLATLNNHVIAGWAAFVSAYLLFEIVVQKKRQVWRFALLGLWTGWTFANELPAGLLVLTVSTVALWTDWRRTLTGYLPVLGLVLGAILLTNYLSIGSIIPAYLHKEGYKSTLTGEPSYWAGPNKSAVDSLNDAPEPYFIYAFHLLFGHHGWFSLTPVLILTAFGAWWVAREDQSPLRYAPWLVLFISAGVFIFFCFVSDQRNYGGMCQGPRWLLWLAPLWLYFLPAAADRFAKSLTAQRWAWGFLIVSAFSVTHAWQNPWSRSWLHRMLFWFGILDY